MLRHSFATIMCILAVVSIASIASADDLVTFNYQGRVKVQGSPFNGTGQFKFAIMNTSASATLWTNDATGIGLGSTEPAGRWSAISTSGGPPRSTAATSAPKCRNRHRIVVPGTRIHAARSASVSSEPT